MSNITSNPPLDLVTEILKSPEAQRMKWMVTQGFYDRSHIGLWLFEIMGRDYDDMAEWSQKLRNEAFPQNCTWSIDIWEWLYGIEPGDTLEPSVRCGRILSKKHERDPINPARIEAILSALAPRPEKIKVSVEENTSPYTFRVIIDESESKTFDHKEALKTLRKIKPSHLSFRYGSIIYQICTNTNTLLFKNFGIQLKIKNLTVQAPASGTLLDGAQLLDGSWLLDGKTIEPSCGFNARRLEMGAFTVKNDFHTAQTAMRIDGLKATQTYGLNASVMMDSGWWTLDGTNKLDGSHKLNKIYIEEVL